MARISTEQPKAIHPAGEAVLTLEKTEIREQDDFNNPEIKVNRLLWIFRSSQIDPACGLGYEFAMWTGLKYGNPKATLTRLLDWMIPGITVAEANDLDTDSLVGNQYQVRIKHGVDQKGQPKAELVTMVPLNGAQPAPAQAAPTAPPATPAEPATRPQLARIKQLEQKLGLEMDTADLSKQEAHDLIAELTADAAKLEPSEKEFSDPFTEKTAA